MLTACEHVTAHKRIISVYTGNKLCRKCNGQNCNGHSGCTANICKTGSIGDEARGSASLMSDLLKDSITVNYVTTDGDSHAGEGVSRVQFQAGCITDVENLRDTRHLGQQQKRKTINTNFSSSMFPGDTKVVREKLHRRFACDLTHRCSVEFQKAYTKYPGNVNYLIKALSYAADAIVACYGGNCNKLCSTYSFACTGAKGKKPWKKQYIPIGTGPLNIDNNDEEKLRKCIAFRFGIDALKKTRLNTNTQKCEAVNRSFNVSNPKSVTWARNFKARIHSAVLHLNQGFAISTIKKCSALGCHLSPSIVQSLKRETKRDKYLALRAKQLTYISYKARRNYLKFQTFKQYDLKHENKLTYGKGIADVDEKSQMQDHTYNKSKKHHSKE